MVHGIENKAVFKKKSLRFIYICLGIKIIFPLFHEKFYKNVILCLLIKTLRKGICLNFEYNDVFTNFGQFLDNSENFLVNFSFIFIYGTLFQQFLTVFNSFQHFLTVFNSFVTFL